MDNPPLAGYDQDLFVARLGVERVAAKALLAAFANMRELNVALLDRLPKDAFTRTGMHAERGPESIQKMVSMYAGHDRIHEAQIERILAERKDARSSKPKDRRKAEKKARRAAEKSLEKARKAEKKLGTTRGEPKLKGAGDAGSAKKSKQKLEATLADR